ncbi:sulfurtransferase-like selenium metabolism protein YedF [Proteinivorax hydrogeniformans]|uniref:Sulfurtransferase-like selenium metabolism protein YedF n=1 Tax=Proteinivorax hydrogeniformans TaxID=1826727 RepID=A0AAU8HUU3_9FIRM
MRIVDNKGLDCPQPVINTKKAIEKGLPVTSIVDNEVARDNVTKLCTKLGFKSQCQEKDGFFHITIAGEEAELVCQEKTEAVGKHLIIQSDKLGQGDDTLGNALMKSFFFTLTETQPYPKRISFVNSGVRLACEGSEVLDAIKDLQQKGTKVASCGICLDFYKLKDKLIGGEITNMYDIVESMNEIDTVSI